MGGSVVRPGVRSATRLLEEKGEFLRWEGGGRPGFLAEPVKAGTGVEGATVRVSWFRPTTLEDNPSVVAAERLAMTEQLRRFLVVNRYAVRYAPDRSTLLLLSPVEQRVEGGKAQHRETGVITAADRSVLPVPVPILGRWNFGVWIMGEASMGGFVLAEHVAEAVELAGRRRIPVVMGGDGSLWFGEREVYRRQAGGPEAERWTPYAVPNEFLELRREHEGVARQCARALVSSRGARWRAVVTLPGGGVEADQVLDRRWAALEVEGLLSFDFARVEVNGAGAVRSWRLGGGLVTWTPEE
ncbi:hypothetical protein [Kitasatospora sp. NPDC094016]|uniref:hypothetical protein n=1 Tax=Kitasatospora sp. NPDC094016 TaxID=3154986 RepID=UPI003322C990